MSLFLDMETFTDLAIRYSMLICNPFSVNEEMLIGCVNHSCKSATIYSCTHIPVLFLSIVKVFCFEFRKKEAQFYRVVCIWWIICVSKTSYWQNCLCIAENNVFKVLLSSC